MSLPKELNDRDLIEHLFGRVEVLEGCLRAYRTAVPAIVSVLTDEQKHAVAERWSVMKSDQDASMSSMKGTYLRGIDLLGRAQKSGLQQEWNLLQVLLAEYAGPTS